MESGTKRGRGWDRLQKSPESALEQPTFSKRNVKCFSEESTENQESEFLEIKRAWEGNHYKNLKQCLTLRFLSQEGRCKPEENSENTVRTQKLERGHRSQSKTPTTVGRSRRPVGETETSSYAELRACTTAVGVISRGPSPVAVSSAKHPIREKIASHRG